MYLQNIKFSLQKHCIQVCDNAFLHLMSFKFVFLTLEAGEFSQGKEILLNIQYHLIWRFSGDFALFWYK